MLLGMMEQLTNKDILYEPMKELDDKFPDWMEKNGAKQTKGNHKSKRNQQKRPQTTVEQKARRKEQFRLKEQQETRKEEKKGAGKKAG